MKIISRTWRELHNVMLDDPDLTPRYRAVWISMRRRLILDGDVALGIDRTPPLLALACFLDTKLLLQTHETIVEA
jgi:hypothetical protein